MSTVREVMTPSPSTCQLTDTVMDALQIMRNERCGVVPILDKQQRIQAMVTDRDIALCLLDNPQAPREIKVQDCIHASQVISIQPDANIQEAIRLMEEHQVRRLPVCDESGRCVGIISQADIVLNESDPQNVLHLVKEISKDRESIGAL